MSEYRTLLSEIADAMLLDRDQLDFFRYNLGIKCKDLIAYGAQYVYLIIHMITGSKGDKEFKNLQKDAIMKVEEYTGSKTLNLRKPFL